MLIKYRLLNILGLVISFLPAVVATYQYYPAIVEVTSSVWDRVGVGTIIAAVFIMAVLIRYASVKYPSPTPDIIFLILWVVCELLKKVIVPMSSIMFWAAVGSIAGRVVLTASDICEKRDLRRMGITPPEKKSGGD